VARQHVVKTNHDAARQRIALWNLITISGGATLQDRQLRWRLDSRHWHGLDSCGMGVVLSPSDNWRYIMIAALTQLTENRKKIALLAILSFIALC
jgi:hypothetical protein